ncbi:GL11334 [Drosophila persimilis]|uniref:60S ribosomal protein L29 n=2 Tax=pseudoobscura subgroup TaxID=32358 RepID=A0A6I8UTA8_DROPS|nr:60S ribosomal protein L29 [Drosophila pseudoobscura]XP_002015944.1 60S ribosomal protein L29 [Drosophila persimilis]XP_017147443.1 60S ribosomal protein L29 [Drosophila miranda]XP_033250749.1 60S ribosomal protein L29 [Drosophila miranda]EDW31834.1 GL11334 [Drosophila persimilis]
MAKSKNHTNHNQNKKAHRNGIKRPMRKRHESTMGMDVKFLINQRYARKGNLSREESVKKYNERIASQQGKPKPITL